MANEIAKVTDQNGVDHPFKDAVAQAGVIANTKLMKDSLGWSGKNKFNYEAFKSVTITNGTAVFENNGITLTASANDCHTANNTNNGYPLDAVIPVSEGQGIKLVWETTEPSYMGDVYIFPNGLTTGMASIGSNQHELEYTPTSGITYVTVRFSVATSGNTAHYKNIMVVDADILDSTYEPYHESVEEMLTAIKDAAVNASDFADFQTRMASI